LFNQTYTVFFFISDKESGKAPPSDAHPLQVHTLAGVHHVFTAPTEVCGNCDIQASAATVVETTMPITSMLIDYRAKGQLRSLNPVDVRLFLMRRLNWRIVTVRAASTLTHYSVFSRLLS